MKHRFQRPGNCTRRSSASLNSSGLSSKILMQPLGHASRFPSTPVTKPPTPCEGGPCGALL